MGTDEGKELICWDFCATDNAVCTGPSAWACNFGASPSARKSKFCFTSEVALTSFFLDLSSTRIAGGVDD